MTGRLRLGAVGAGAHASENLLPAIRSSPDFDLVGICTRSPESASAAAARWGARVATASIGELCDEADALVACGPPQLHEQAIAAAVERGLPLLVEKPPARSAARLASVMVGGEVPVFVDYNMRFASAWEIASSVLPPTEATFARIRMVGRKPRGPLWGCQSTLRSLLLAVGVHAVDLALDTVGWRPTVSSSVTDLGTGRLSVAIVLRSKAGPVAVIETGNYAQGFELEVDLVGDRDRVVVEDLARVSVARSVAGRISDKATEQHVIGGLTGGYERNGYGTVLSRFARAARGEEPSASGLNRSLAVLSVIDQVCERHEEPTEDW